MIGDLPFLSFTPWVLLRRQEFLFSAFTALQLLVLAACYDGFCPQHRISHRERTLFFHLFIQAPPCGVSQDEGTDLDQRSMSSERGKLKCLSAQPPGPKADRTQACSYTEELQLFSLCSKKHWGTKKNQRKKNCCASINTSATLVLLSGSLTISCTVGGESPSMFPWRTAL